MNTSNININPYPGVWGLTIRLGPIGPKRLRYCWAAISPKSNVQFSQTRALFNQNPEENLMATHKNTKINLYPVVWGLKTRFWAIRPKRLIKPLIKSGILAQIFINKISFDPKSKGEFKELHKSQNKTSPSGTSPKLSFGLTGSKRLPTCKSRTQVPICVN